MGTVVQPDNTIRNSLSFDQFDPSDLSSVVAVGTATSLGINALDVDNSKFITWDNTTLVQVETILQLCFLFVHNRLADCGAVVDDSVCLIFDGSFFLLGQALIVSDIQVSDLGGLLGTVLPNVRPQDLSAGSEYDVSTSMVSLELLSSLWIDGHMDLLSLVELEVAFQWSVKSVKDAFTYFDGIYNFV